VELDLIQRIKDFKPTEAYVLTFSIDLHYYEGFFLPLIQQLGCTKNIVIADSNKISENLETNSSYINKLGREYLLIPIHSDFAFHPKIYLFKKVLKDTTSLLCFVGSGNLTYPGLNTNQEIFVEEIWEKTGRPPQFWNEVSEYFNVILGSCRGEAAKLVKKWLSYSYPQQFEKENENLSILIRYPAETNIFEQFKARLKGKPVKNIFLTAPFYDEDLSAIKKVVSECKPKKIELLIQPGKTSVTTKKFISFVKANPNITLKAFEPKNYLGRYLHAKMIVATTGAEEHVLSGSANLSDVALLGRPKAFNYEACVYTRVDLKNSVLERLGIEKMSKPISLDKMPETVVEIAFKESEGPKFKLISSECYGGKCYFTVIGAEKHSTLDAELRYSDNKRGTIVLTQKKDSKDTFICEGRALFSAIAARILAEKDLYTKWTPILFVAEIERRSRRYFEKAEKLKDSFLRAANELNRDNYLDLIFDSLIEDSLKALEAKVSSSRVSLKEDDAMKGVATINIETETPIIEKTGESTAGLGFNEGLDYVISVLRERRQAGSMEEDVTNTEQDKEFEEYDQKLQESTEAQLQEVDILYAISRRLKSRRRVFIKNESIKDPVVRSSYFSLIALPHMPKLHRYYIGDDKERHSCVSDDDWNEFVIESCNSLGLLTFKTPSKDIWPDLGVDILKKDIFEVCIVSILYSFVTVYPILKYRSNALGDEGFNSCLQLNRFTNLLAAMLQNYLKIEGSSPDILKDKLNEIREHFPCGWLFVEKSLVEVFDNVLDVINHNFKNPKVWEFGDLSYIAGKGFLLRAKGKSILLWE